MSIDNTINNVNRIENVDGYESDDEYYEMIEWQNSMNRIIQTYIDAIDERDNLQIILDTIEKSYNDDDTREEIIDKCKKFDEIYYQFINVVDNVEKIESELQDIYAKYYGLMPIHKIMENLQI
jgi:hypothetical protein